MRDGSLVVLRSGFVIYLLVFLLILIPFNRIRYSVAVEALKLLSANHFTDNYFSQCPG